ncbi:hypothetical protein D9M68_451760 [compost metagenome]
MITTTGIAYSAKVLGLISIPTDTKKTAPKRSFTGFIRCSIRSALVVSAIIEPMIKAPKAGENPAIVAKITIIKHKARETISSVSSLKRFFAFFNNVGMKKIPPTNHKIKKNKSFSTDSKSSIPENCWLIATVESNTIIKMATMSSTIKAPKTIPANFWPFTPNSSKARRIIVVDEIDKITPRKILSIDDQPIICPHQ